MLSRVVAITGQEGPAPAAEQAHLLLAWEGPQRNLRRDLQPLYRTLPRAPGPLAADLLDIATAVYGTDLGLPRGRNEAWVRHVELTIPVRHPDFWQSHASDLTYLLYVLTRDGFDFEFVPRAGDAPEEPAGAAPAGADCVCLFSGGVDSLAGAAMLLRADRRPLLVCHQSGNPTIRKAQGEVAESLRSVRPADWTLAGVGLQAHDGAAQALPFPGAADREPSQRSRSFLYMSAALAAAEACQVREAYLCENGILTMALPLSGARIGGLSTRSTHPRVVTLMNRLAQAAGLGAALVNPFMYQTKAEIIRDLLRPALSPFQIQKTVSCWATGRASRQCGGCVACLVRRLSMLAAGLPDEAYEIDILGKPGDYGGTEAYVNLVDLLGLCAEYQREDNLTLLQRSPELLDCWAAGASLADALAMYRRFAGEVRDVLDAHFPAAARLMPAP